MALALPTKPTTCDLSTVAQPSSTLAPPTGLTLKLIALGKGTQNYTCATPTSTPASNGAVAQLWDFSCSVAKNGPVPIATIGKHFFFDATTPEFDLNGLGNTRLSKKEVFTAPIPAADVPWLRLETVAAGTTSPVKMIYRLKTKGGVAPATCAGKKAGSTVTVPYEAQYWVYV
ncbi:hypothetical protein BCR34DRAFT_482778 [Clohesyomyces aquaticus]|uniref:Malate dehydrogenase n=1 Tax=Clohesyomyces aquaticus TaxID=1231657 RepID=A0A1Y1ZQ44_9PLEO|nr:hypothetical protein BCR34DRAFT_482778 [Clohesyomyces aquaticus]